MPMDPLPTYDRTKTYQWNYDHAPAIQSVEIADVPGDFKFCGLQVDSPLGVPSGPLLNGKWCLYYASLGFDVVTYKTVRSGTRLCYDLPNLQPVLCDDLHGGEGPLPATSEMHGSWAVSFGMPSTNPAVWKADVRETRDQLPLGKLLNVSVVGTVQPDWEFQQLADDYALCAQQATESGADTVETNFSCPNVSTCDGQIYQDPIQAEIVARTVRSAIGDTPYIAKVGRITSSSACKELVHALAPFVDAIAMTNSIATQVREPDGNLLFGESQRGICGKATLEASISQVQEFHTIIEEESLELALIGVGGASCYDDAQRYLNAGAHAVHIATAAMINPLTAKLIRDQWSAR